MRNRKLLMLLFVSSFLFGCTGAVGPQGEKGDSGTPGLNGSDGKDGQDGKDGVSIISISKTSSSGNIDVYTIYYSDGKTSTFSVTNGKDGTNGSNGSDGKDGNDGHAPQITIDSNGYWCVDGQSTGVKAKGENGANGSDGQNGSDGEKGDKGDKGADGVGISNVTYSYDSEGNTLVAISFTDGTSKEIVVAKGDKGDKGDKGEKGDKGNDGKSLLTGNGEPSSSLGNDGDSYLDLDTWKYYSKANGSWSYAGSIKGSDGSDGNNGKDGEKGVKGDKGDTGVSVVSTKIDENGNLIIAFSDGTTQNAGHLKDVSKQQFTVNFHVDDEIVKTLVVEEDSKISAPTEEETAGYTIDKWHLEEGNAKSDWIFSYFKVDQNTDLYADFTYNEYVVTFMEDEYGNILESATVTYDKDYSIQQFAGVDGYTHIGWKSTEGTLIGLSGKWRVASDTILNAVWTKNEYKVILNPADGTVESSSLLVTYDETYSLPTPTRTNYTFLGWYDSEDKRVSQKATWKRTQDETFIAKWTNVANTYTFDAGDGTCDVESMVIGWEDAYELPTPTSSYDSFLGWYLDGVYVPQSGDKWTYSNTGGILVAFWLNDFSQTSSYPQTVVKDQELNNLLNEKSGELPTSADDYNWTSYGYLNTQMWYQDVDCGNKHIEAFISRITDHLRKIRNRQKTIRANIAMGIT